MTGADVPRIDIRNLLLGDVLGKGGQGQVTAVNGVLVQGHWPAVLKQYTPDARRTMRAAVLEAIVGFPGQLPPHDSRWLHQSTAWPTVVAQDNGAPCGFLMRAVPPEYYFNFQTQTRGAQRKLADLAFLLNPDDYLRRSGIMIRDQDRLALLASAAALLSRLHSLGAVVGDLSPKNLLFSLAPVPSCFLIDCDAIRLHGETVLDQVETPDWEVPRGEPRATLATDAYKFGLLAIRLFAREQSVRDTAALEAVSPELGSLAQLSQDPDPRRRPAPGTWITALDASTPASPTAHPPAAATPYAAPASARISVPIPPVSATETRPAPRAPAPARRRGRRRRRFVGPLLLVLLVAAVAAGLVGAAVHGANQSHAAATQASSIGDSCLVGTWHDGTADSSTKWNGHTVAMTGGSGDIDHISASGTDVDTWGHRAKPLYGTYQGNTLEEKYRGQNTITIQAHPQTHQVSVREDGWSGGSTNTFTYEGRTLQGYFGPTGGTTYETYRCTAHKLKWFSNNRLFDTETRISRNP